MRELGVLWDRVMRMMGTLRRCGETLLMAKGPGLFRLRRHVGASAARPAEASGGQSLDAARGIALTLPGGGRVRS
jgi:hypothetical protein